MVLRCPNLSSLESAGNPVGPDVARRLGEAAKNSGCAGSLCELVDVARCGLGPAGPLPYSLRQ